MRPCRTFDKKTLIKILLKKLLDTWTFDSYLTVMQNRLREKYEKFKRWNFNVRYTAGTLAWRGGCRMRWCQEIKYFWRILSCLNIIVRWNFGTRDKILSFAFLFFSWDNASQKLTIPSHSAKWELLICTLGFWDAKKYTSCINSYQMLFIFHV